MSECLFGGLLDLVASAGGLQPEDSTAASGKSTQTCEPATKRQRLSPGASAKLPEVEPVAKPAQKPLKIPQTSDASRWVASHTQ